MLQVPRVSHQPSCTKKLQLARETEEIRQEKEHSGKAFERRCETDEETAVRQHKDRVTKKTISSFYSRKKNEVSASRKLARNAKCSAKRSKVAKIASSRKSEAMNDDDIIAHNIGKADVHCEFCGTLKFSP